MPELPEVETTRRGIEPVILNRTLQAMQIRERRFRWPIPDELPQVVIDQPLLAVGRRAKYLLLSFPNGTIIIHLGMSGSIRRVQADSFWNLHDHVEWTFEGGQVLRLHDPRRFGAVLWHPIEDGDILSHPLLKNLGVEPMGEEFTAKYLYDQTRNQRIHIKQSLLNGKIVVGVGNIYASESLFRARIHPETPAQNLTRSQATRLFDAINQTLEAALTSGGSTLRDYMNPNAQPGAYFELHAAVYGKADEPCPQCGTKIQRIVQNQRATYFCPKCQRRPRTRKSAP